MNESMSYPQRKRGRKVNPEVVNGGDGLRGLAPRSPTVIQRPGLAPSKMASTEKRMSIRDLPLISTCELTKPQSLSRKHERKGC